MSSYDVVVVGGGHNGLVAASTLARKGRKVLVLEARDCFGGVAAGEEFAAGFRTRGLLHDTSRLAPELISGLQLTTRPPAPVLGVQDEGPGLLLHRDPQQSSAEIAEHRPEDAAGYRAWRARADRFGAVLRTLMEKAPFDFGIEAPLFPLFRAGLGLRRLGKRDMMDLLRVAPGRAEDWVREYMETPLLQAMVLAPGLRGTWMGPQSPSSAATLLLHESLVGLELAEGPQALVDALLADCRKRGVELRPGSVVRRIRVERGAVVGLELADGSVDASTVLSSIGPRRTLLELVEARQVPDSLHREVSCIRVRGTLARVSFGLKDRPEFRCRPDLEVTAAHVGDSPIALEKGFDHAKHRRMPKSPPLDIRVFPSDGGWVVSCLLRSAAFDLDGGWSPQRHQELGDEVAASLEGVILGFRDSVVAREVLTPADLARRYGLEGGHEMHGELGLDQLHVLRPSRRLARYRSGIDGLWLGSSGCHPGGGVTGRPGLLSARALLRG